MLVGYIAHRGVTSQERARRQQYFAELRLWADECTLALSEAVHLCDLDPVHCDGTSFFDRRHALRIRLSALIDRGRWFFPNLDLPDYGQWKPEAFRGLRQPVLDTLVYAYNAVSALDYRERADNLALRGPLVEVKRAFVAEIQNILDPRKAQEEFGQAMSRR